MAPALEGYLGGVDPTAPGSIEFYSVKASGGGWANVSFEVIGVIFDLGYSTARDFQVAFQVQAWHLF